MNTFDRSTIVGAVGAVVILVGGLMAVWWVTFDLWYCGPPRDQAEMIELFEADPLVAAAPEDAELVDEYSHTAACDSGRGGSPLGPGFAEVMRLYSTPTAYSVDQLRRLFDEPAAAGGWRLLAQWRPGDPEMPGDVALRYCKEAGGRAALAYVRSSAETVWEEPSEPDESGRSLPGVEVRLSADPDLGTDCNDILREWR